MHLCLLLTENNDILLASSSQDTFIRLWRISSRNDSQLVHKKVSVLLPDEDIQIEERVFSVKSNDKIHNFAVALESVLLGHDAWVYGVYWNKLEDGK